MVSCNYTRLEFGGEFPSDEELAAVDAFRCYSESLRQFASACCVIFMLIGIPGNLTTIVALARCRKVRNATAIFIINLHISDLISNCFFLPVSAVTLAKGHWTHGWVMCRLFPYFKYVLNTTSILTVLAISVNRYIIVCHPLLYPKLYKRRNITISIMMIWVSALAMFVAPAFGAWGRFGLDPNGGFCTMIPDRNGNSPKYLFMVTAFVVPYLTIGLCYAQIWWVVRNTKNTHSKNPTRPTHLPLPKIQSDTSTDGQKLTSFDRSPGSTTDNDKTPTSSETSAPQSPNDEKAFGKYFKTQFRLTKKSIKPKTPTSKDKKLCAMIAAIMISFCICHLPVMATRLAYKEFRTEPIAKIFSHLLQELGTCMNPIIYVLMSVEYRQAYKSLYETILKKFQRR